MWNDRQSNAVNESPLTTDPARPTDTISGKEGKDED